MPKICACGERDSDKFYERDTSCKKCRGVKNKANKQKLKQQDPTAYRRKQYDYELRRAYGISLIEYDEMFAEQGGRCAICKEKSSQFLSVDHHELTGDVRELLCQPCNLMLGYARENPTTLEAAAVYLRRHPYGF